MTMMRIPTGISEAYWCSPSQHANPDLIKPAIIEHISKTKHVNLYEGISWFDELFEGGILLPEKNDKQDAITLLITGPPGSGKSTLAMELAYRWFSQKLHTLYITSESSSVWLYEKAKSFKWNITDEHFHNVSNSKTKHVPHIDIAETRDFRVYLGSEEKHESPILEILKTVASFGGQEKPIKSTEKLMSGPLKQLQIDSLLSHQSPDVLIIDSLNTVKIDQRSRLFEKYAHLTQLGPRLIIIVLDSGSNNDVSDFWGYLCDIVLRMDKVYDHNYMVRTFEIQKARYQTHVWGIHQLKIYEPTEFGKFGNHEQIRRSHPFRKEGGLFIFPSIHYFLSTYKRKSPEHPPFNDETKLENLNIMLNGGFPKGRCIGFTGLRGGHKSHLGYLHLLYKVIEGKKNIEVGTTTIREKGIIISLRDDEGMARQTLEKIISQEFGQERLDTYLNNDLLDILYYPPGYITPEEFFHRMYISIQRLKSRNKSEEVNITLLFNSLDQLSSRFPLCAAEKIFIPGIIETLTAEGITSIFIGVEEPGQPPEQYGLLSMADLILSFNQKNISQEVYLSQIKRYYQNSTKLLTSDLLNIQEKIGSEHRVVEVNVDRFAGGQAAGSSGILELIDEESYLKDLYGRSGLCFTILPRSKTTS